MDTNIINSVEISGNVASECTFSHEIYGEEFYSFYLSSRRLSGTDDTIKVTISERILDKERTSVGSFVYIKGQIRSYNSYSENKSRLIITVFTKEIEYDRFDEVNNVVLDGFICKKPVYRSTPLGREISDILLAVNRAYNKSDYIPCICWGRNAKYTNEFEVGENIKIYGRIQSRIYKKHTENGEEERTAYEVSVSRLEKKKKEEIEENNDWLQKKH